MNLSLDVAETVPLQSPHTQEKDLELGLTTAPSSSVVSPGGIVDAPPVPPTATQEESLEAYRERTKGIRNKTFCSACIDCYFLTLLGHRFHFTEVFCLGAFALCVVLGVFVITNSSLPAYIFSIVLAIYSLFSIFFVWGYVKISSLAAIATRLENLAKRGTIELEKYRVINKSLDGQTKTYKNHLGQLGAETDGIDSETSALNQLLPKLEEMQKKHEEMNNVQIELGDKEEQYAYEQSLAVEDKGKEVIKTALRVQFETFTRVHGRQGVFHNDEYTKNIVTNFFTTHKLEIDQDIKEILSQKYLYLHHLISYIDKYCNTRFYRLKFATETTKKKEIEVAALRKKLEDTIIKCDKELKKLKPQE